METKSHWENVYTTKDADAVSWFQPHATRSLALINKLVPDTSASVLDVGGGASTLVDELLAQGFSNVSVLDLSANAPEVVKKRLGIASAS